MTEAKEDSWDNTQSNGDSTHSNGDSTQLSVENTQLSVENTQTKAETTQLKGGLNKVEVVKSKRLFGMIKGTLNSLKEKTDGDRQREKVQEKLLEKLNKEKKEIQEKLKQEISEKKNKVLISRKKEDVARLDKLLKFLELYLQKLDNFNQTKTEPKIYFKPKKHSVKSRENSKRSLKSLEIVLKEYMEKEYPEVEIESEIQDQVMQE